jgi:hypothetical protein
MHGWERPKRNVESSGSEAVTKIGCSWETPWEAPFLPESDCAELEALANKSGKKGCKRPGLSETVRAALRLLQSRQGSSEEISQAFAEDVGVGE